MIAAVLNQRAAGTAYLDRRDYLSFSAVTLYQKCPLAFRFRYIDGIREDTMPSALAFGRSIHHAIERWYEARLWGEPELDSEALLTAFWDEWRCCDEETPVRYGDREDAASFSDLAGRVLAAFVASDAARIDGNVIGIEEELRGELINSVPGILGRVDLLLETEAALGIVDWKTSRSRWSDSQATDAAPQLHLYGELAESLGIDKPVRLVFGVIAKTKTPSIELHDVTHTQTERSRTRAMLSAVWRAVSAGHFYPAPSALNCSTCPYRAPCREWRG
jgi:RecB family exonuclease